MAVGIVSYGIYLPKGIETAAQMAARCGLTEERLFDLGLRRRHVPADEDQPVAMAVKASRTAFQSAGGLDPMEVDVVIWTGEEYKDYIAQTPSIRLQEETGCKNAWAFDLVGQSVTLIQGLKVAHDLIAGDTTIRTVLLAGGTRNIDLVKCDNPHTRFLIPCSASGGAVILRRDHDRNLLLETAFLVHPEMADEVFVPGGGTETPFSPENLSTDIMFFQARHPQKVADYLERRWAASLCEIAAKLQNAPDIGYLALRHLAPCDRDNVLETLGIEPRQSAALDSYGHHGTNDPLLSLDLGLKRGAVEPGTVVAMLNGGIGFTYAAAALRWG